MPLMAVVATWFAAPRPRDLPTSPSAETASRTSSTQRQAAAHGAGVLCRRAMGRSWQGGTRAADTEPCGLPAELIGAGTVVSRTTLRDDAGMSTKTDETGGLRASARSVGGSLRQEVWIDGGRHILLTDEPERLGGADAGPAPHELFPAALASCISTTILMYARTRGWEIGDVRVDVDYDHRSTPRRFAIAVHLDPSLAQDRLKRLTKVAEGCPVRRAIESGIVFEERMLLDQAPGAGPSPIRQRRLRSRA